MTKKRRVGILGGTFDPIHYGHLRAAIEVAEQLDLAEVVLMPNHIPPHKAAGAAATARQRLHLARLATADQPRLLVSDLELRRDEPSYTLLTLRRFCRERGRHIEPVFILGADAFSEIDTWYEFETLFTETDFAVLTRPGTPLRSLAGFLPRKTARLFTRLPDEAGRFAGRPLRHQSGKTIWPIKVTQLDISASLIRRLCSEGRSIRHLTPDPVADYIRRKKLYRK